MRLSTAGGRPPASTTRAPRRSSSSTASSIGWPMPIVGQPGPHHLLDRLVEHRRVVEGPVHQRQLVDGAEDLGRGQRHLALRHRELRHAVPRIDVDGVAHASSSGWTYTSGGMSPPAGLEDVGHRVLAGGPQEAVAGHPVVVEDPRQVAPARVGDQHHDQVARAEAAADLERGRHRGAARAADEQALLAGHPRAMRKQSSSLIGTTRSTRTGS